MNLNLLQQVIEAPRLKRYVNPRITRSGLSSNPLQRYSFTGGDIYKIDDLVTLNGKITETAKSKTYDFAQVNVPMKFYRVLNSIIQMPTGTWTEYGASDQAVLDLIKTQNGVLKIISSTVLGETAQFMVELDLTTLANELGGNAKLKEALTGITVDAWAMGSGSNAGVLGNGVTPKLWIDNSSWVSPNANQNSTSSIAKITCTIGGSTDCSRYTSSSNKLYILIASQFPSDGVIASSVSLDYISVKIDYKQRTVVNDGAFFIGGDVATYEFDMGLKVAGSVAECPIKIYAGAYADIRIPTGQWGTYYENQQTEVDKLKSQNSNSLILNSNSWGGAGLTMQAMLELDLTPLCNSLFGGSNSALKAALKSITCDVWAQGSGASGGVLANGCSISLYGDGVNVINWYNVANNSTASIAQKSYSSTSGRNFLQSSNKLYILIASQYASDGTIPSTVQLDYFNIKIDIARTPDVVSPTQVNLPKYWAIRGDIAISTEVKKDIILAYFIKGTDENNRAYIIYRYATGILDFVKFVNGTSYTASITLPAFNKFQVIKYIFEQNASGMFVSALLNNGVKLLGTNTNTNLFTGLASFAPLSKLYSNVYNADAFAESFHLVDLARINRPNGFTDAEAEGILRGVIKGKNLFDKSKVTSGYYISTGGTLATNALYGTSDYISIQPNTNYYKTNTYNIAFYDSNKQFISMTATQGVISPTNAMYCRFTVVLANLNTEQLEQSSTATAYEPYLENPLGITNPELFDINKVTLYSSAVIENNGIAINTTVGTYKNSYLRNVAVLPNNRYKLTFDLIGDGGYMEVASKYNNIVISGSIASSVATSNVNGTKELIFTTGNNVNNIDITITNNKAGTFKWSNIKLNLLM